MRLSRSDDTKRRLNLIMPLRAFERLGWLRKRTDAASDAEVIRNALFSYMVLVERAAAGSQLMELTKSGKLQPLPLSIDVAPPQVVPMRPDGDTAIGQRKAAMA